MLSLLATIEIMKLSQELALKQVQTLKLTPQLQLAVKVLQANQVQLNEMIEQEVMENPVLEVGEVPSQLESQGSQDYLEPQTERTQLLEYVKDFEKYFAESQDTYSGSYITQRTSSEESSIEEYVAGRRNLKDILDEQLFLSTSVPIERRIGSYIIASLDHNGYLGEEVSKIANSLMVDFNQVERVLILIQGFDPVGIAARDLRECLLIQYHQKELNDSLIRSILEDHLEDLANNRMKDISLSTGASFEQIATAAQAIRGLNPRPAAGFLHEVSTAEIITPDLFVSFEEDQLIINLNDSYIPNLGINSYYQEKIQNAEGLDKQELTYLRKKLNQALWFRQCIEKRRETIFSVAKCIFEIQREFFDDGVKGLKPLTLADVASRVDRHEATVSRVVNGKYAQTPSGVFELKFFFTGGLRSDDGEMISTLRIKEIIQQAISEENPKKPLSDQVLSDLLKARGIEVARRTVTKYREMLGIQSSSKRKKYV
ncbi:MAG: RNA polymerase factor sigma-54 [bacterium]|nr:RNA polymerase factor sigma-54 [bacterium]